MLIPSNNMENILVSPNSALSQQIYKSIKVNFLSHSDFFLQQKLNLKVIGVLSYKRKLVVRKLNTELVI
jgi:hypothetical protein